MNLLFYKKINFANLSSTYKLTVEPIKIVDMISDSESFDGSANGKKKSITFRVDKDALNKIKFESSTKDINLNALVNQILKRYVEWDAFESKVGLVPLSKKTY